MVSEAELGREAAIRDANASVRVVHLDERSILVADTTPQAIGVRPLNVIGAQLARRALRAWP